MDIVFSFLWARLLHDLQAQLRDLGLESTIPEVNGFQPFDALDSDNTTGCLGPTWMDDLCLLCVADESAPALEHEVSQSISLLLSICGSFALSPNLKPGKTEILLALQGRNSCRLKSTTLDRRRPNSSSLMRTPHTKCRSSAVKTTWEELYITITTIDRRSGVGLHKVKQPFRNIVELSKTQRSAWSAGSSCSAVWS